MAISPYTHPGTAVVCVDDSPARHFLVVGRRFLEKGRVYHVREIVMGWTVTVCLLMEVTLPPGLNGEEIGIPLGRFEYAELPRCLTELLTTAPKELEKAR